MFTSRSALALFISGLSFSRGELTAEEQVEYSITMAEFDKLTTTDIFTEFGTPLNQTQGEEFFRKALVFAFDHAENALESTQYTLDDATRELYYNYIACNTAGLDVSINQRKQQMLEEIEKGGIDTTKIFFDGTYGRSGSDTSCWLTRFPGNGFEKAYIDNAKNSEVLKVTPLISQMKITKGTVDAAELIMKGNTVVDLNLDKDAKADSKLGLHLSMCPGVYNFEGKEYTDDHVTKEVVDFITNGEVVKSASWAYNSISGAPTEYSDRMKLWYDATKMVVDDMGTGDNNNCYNAIKTHMLKDSDSYLDGFSVTFDTIDTEKLGFASDNERNMCIYYIIHSLSLYQSVCAVEPVAVNSIPTPTPTSSGMSMMLLGKVGGLSAVFLAVATAAFSFM